MRPIEPDLYERLQKQRQTLAENADPRLKVLLSKGFNKNLFNLFTVHELEGISSIDVTARRQVTSDEPDELYIIYRHNNQGHVAKKNLPFDEHIPWEPLEALGDVLDVAITFDGYWERDNYTKYYNFITEPVPHLFWIDEGKYLVTKQLLDNATERILATDVEKIATIRGWVSANGNMANDQGLIIAYIKSDGLCYYRNYCIQETGEKLWEAEGQLTFLSAVPPYRSISCFRTNDFRIGIAIEDANHHAYLKVTERNYGGMSFPPEVICSTMKTTKMDVTRIDYEDWEHDTINLRGSYFAPIIGIGNEQATPSTVQAEMIDAYTLRLVFSDPFFGYIDKIKPYLTITDATGNVYWTIETITQETSNSLLVTTTTAFDIYNDMYLSYSGDAVIVTRVEPSMLMKVPGFSVMAQGFLPIPYHDETITGYGAFTHVATTEIFYTTNESDRADLYGSFGAFIQVELTKSPDGSDI